MGRFDQGFPAKGAAFELSFHAIQIIELKFTIDKHTACMVALRVLSRTNLAERTPLTSSISFISIRLQPLCRLQKSHPFAIKQIQPLFVKHPGVGVPNTFAPSFAFAVTCPTWRLYPLYPHSIAHTSCHHGGVPLRELVRCTEAAKMPLCKSFICYSYALLVA